MKIRRFLASGPLGAFGLYQLSAGHEFSRLEPWDAPVPCHIDQYTATHDAMAVVVDSVNMCPARGHGTNRYAVVELAAVGDVAQCVYMAL